MPGTATLAASFATICEHWAPRVVASCHDNDRGIVRVAGKSAWRERLVALRASELFVVPRRGGHRPVARRGEVGLRRIGRAGTATAGNAAGASAAVPI